ncbi:MAG: alpha/beta hydrolase, partial [Chthoniobacterales bacterium]|nr:alpha/beta hydrolase [Chthoniobacterales bacterium]
MNKLLQLFLIVLVSLALGRSVQAVVPTTEVFGNASDGTVLHWMAYTPTTPGPWPVVLIIHGGGFDSNTPDSSPESVNCAQDMAAAGYIAFSIEYRLAPPGALPGQVSDGRFPDQSDDAQVAIRAARADQRGNGQVAAVGGSGGGYLTAFWAGSGTPGDDRIDVGVSLSGVYDLSDFSPNPTLNYFTSTVTNYVDVDSTDTEALRAASPAWLVDSAIAPLLMVNSISDPMPYSQMGDMIEHLDALGVTNYQAISFPGGTHAFANWPSVKEQALAFIANGFAGIAPPPPVPVPPPGSTTKQLLNVSTRATAGAGNDVMIGGFIVSGTTNKRVVLRALGPSLAQSGVNGILADPVLTLYNANGVLMESNDNRLQLGGVVNPLLPSNSAESYLTAILPPGSYTTVLEGVNGSSGAALVEAYDLTPGNSRVVNISTRADIAFAGDVMVGGFIIGGTDSTQVIVRGLGPSLASYGISNPLPNPALEIYDSNGVQVGTNDDWRSIQAHEIQATTLQ